METTTYTSKTLDHLGLITGLIREIGISEWIDSSYADQKSGSDSKQRKMRYMDIVANSH